MAAMTAAQHLDHSTGFAVRTGSDDDSFVMPFHGRCAVRSCHSRRARRAMVVNYRVVLPGPSVRSRQGDAAARQRCPSEVREQPTRAIPAIAHFEKSSPCAVTAAADQPSTAFRCASARVAPTPVHSIRGLHRRLLAGAAPAGAGEDCAKDCSPSVHSMAAASGIVLATLLTGRLCRCMGASFNLLEIRAPFHGSARDHHSRIRALSQTGKDGPAAPGSPSAPCGFPWKSP